MGKKIGLQEVARLAGVSVATVSRVANGANNVSPELRQRVMKAAGKLGVDLERRSKAKVVAFLLSNREVLHPFHSSVLIGAEAYCAAHDYGLLFLPLRYSLHLTWQNLAMPQIDQHFEIIRGAILAGTNSQSLLDLLSHKGIPFVVLGNNVVGPWSSHAYSAVYFDDIDGAAEMTRYLQSLGHQHIWFVGNTKLPWFARRAEGYRRAMEEAALEPRVSEVDSDNPEDVGYLAAKTLLSRQERVTAIFAGDDAAARGAYKAIRDRGLLIPDDISVAGFNDTLEVSAMHPPLTTVHVFTDQIGRHMAELVMNHINHPDAPPQVLTLPTRLVKRESCRALSETTPANVTS